MTSLLHVSRTFSGLVTEMNKVIIGYAEVKKLSIASLFAGQHTLLEGLPGTAKSLFVEVFQHSISDSLSQRIQITPDVKPMDLIGVKVYNPSTGKFDIEFGPMHGKNFVLIDEINRGPGKTLSSILSAMQEKCLFISGQRFVLPKVFFVMATQNPIEQEGVYPLPEAAVDRFGIKIIVPYLSAAEERQLLHNEALDTDDPLSVVNPVVSIDEVLAIRTGLRKEVYVSPAAVEYIVALIRATRPDLEEHKLVAAKSNAFADQIEVGSSVRGQFALRSMARVYAALAGRNFVMPEDIQAVAVPVMRHRIAQTFEAVTDDRTSDQAAEAIIEHTPFHEAKDKYTPPQVR